jgi:hypothetical protein
VIPTPPEYKQSTVVIEQRYMEDSIYLYNVVESMLLKHIEPFSPPSYYTKTTEIYLDSVLYSPNQLRLIVFVISKVPRRTALANGKDTLSYDYDAYYLFCGRDNLNSSIKVFEYCPFRIGNYASYKEVKYALNELCFGRRATDLWNNQEPKRNIDDSRFWNSNEFNSVLAKSKYVQLETK